MEDISRVQYAICELVGMISHKLNTEMTEAYQHYVRIRVLLAVDVIGYRVVAAVPVIMRDDFFRRSKSLHIPSWQT